MSKAPKTANGHAGEAEARRFLRLLFGRAPAEAYLLVWEKRGGDKVSTWFPAKRVDDAAAFAVRQQGDVYFGVCLSPKDYGPRQRCPQKEALGVVGLWVDIDVAGEGHMKPNLPATFDEALDLACSLGVAPSAVIDSGHGLHAWWLFFEPWVFSDSAERDEARAVSERLQAALRRNAEARGWTIDSTHDLARVLRVPGTVNHKGAPVPVRLVEADGTIRYTPADFFALLADDPPAEAPTSRPRAARAAPSAGGASLSIAERAQRYVAKMPHSISGRGGMIRRGPSPRPSSAASSCLTPRRGRSSWTSARGASRPGSKRICGTSWRTREKRAAGRPAIYSIARGPHHPRRRRQRPQSPRRPVSPRPPINSAPWSCVRALPIGHRLSA